ncbi:MAG: hypothetical protein M0P74_14500 [Syntrophales bacterium]|jgi:hypothetical protein|nr:hypothetical protein [Syntrophales bacterium]
MKRMSRIYFNPATKEIELEGSEEFIKTYFDKLQQMLSEFSGKVKEEPKAATALPAERIMVKKLAKVEIPAPQKVIKAAKEKTIEKQGKGNFTNTVIALIQDSPEGITLSELMEKAGLTARQVITITSRVAKLGKIKRAKRGTYVAIG